MNSLHCFNHTLQVRARPPASVVVVIIITNSSSSSAAAATPLQCPVQQAQKPDPIANDRLAAGQICGQRRVGWRGQRGLAADKPKALAVAYQWHTEHQLMHQQLQHQYWSSMSGTAQASARLCGMVNGEEWCPSYTLQCVTCLYPAMCHMPTCPTAVAAAARPSCRKFEHIALHC
jgi:hypothetical protein